MDAPTRPAPLTGRPVSVEAWVVANPAAGRGRRRQGLEGALQVLRRAGWRLHRHRTEGPGHAVELARAAASAGADVCLVAAGDGTVNEVANGLAGAPCALAVLPLGTGNVLAAQLGLVGLPTAFRRPDPVTAAGRLTRGRVAPVDLGLVRPNGGPDRFFVLWCGVGFDASVIERVERSAGSAKRALGPLAFAAAGLGELARASGTPSIVHRDGALSRTRLLVAIAANVPLYAGAVRLARGATLDDGRLDLTVLEATSPAAAALELGRSALRSWLGSASWPSEPVRRADVASRVSLPVHVDAEICGRTPVSIRVEPAALRLLVPDGAPAGLLSRAEGAPA